jgi:hypothetical protein
LYEDSIIFHYVIGMAGGGIPSAAMLAYAIADGDEEQIKEAALVEVAVLGTQYAALQALNWIQGPKYRMSFHALHTGLNAARGLITTGVVKKIAPGLTAGAMAATIVYAGDEVLQFLTDGMARIMPDEDFMKFTQY